jgi:hypothetical protein
MSSRTRSRNAFETQLDGALNNSATSFDVVSSTGLVHPTYICIDPDDPVLREYIRIDSISGTTWSSVTRGIAGSAGGGASAHLTGAACRAVPVHQWIDDIYDDIEALETADAAHFGGTDTADHPEATTSVRGFMSDTDKTKLDGIATGAVADHGAATGLGDDDHTDYLKEKLAGGLAIEVPEHVHNLVSGDDGGQLVNYPRSDLLNAKGSMYGASAVDVPASIGIGVDGQVPVADASAFAGVRWDTMTIFVRKATGEGRSTTTLAEDSELRFDIAANEEWFFWFYLESSGINPSPGIKHAILGPAGAQIRAHEMVGLDKNLVLAAYGVGDENNTGIGRATGQASFQGYIQNAGTAGRCSLWFAKDSSSAGDNSVDATSYMIAHRVASA